MKECLLSDDNNEIKEERNLLEKRRNQIICDTRQCGQCQELRSRRWAVNCVSSYMFLVKITLTTC